MGRHAIRKTPEEEVGMLKSITQGITNPTGAKHSVNESGAKFMMLAVAVALALAFAYYLISRREVAAPERVTVDLEAGLPMQGGHKPRNFLGFWPGRGKSRFGPLEKSKSRLSLGVPGGFTSRLSSRTGRSKTRSSRSGSRSGRACSRSRSRRSRSRHSRSRASKPRARRMSSTKAVKIGASQSPDFVEIGDEFRSMA